MISQRSIFLSGIATIGWLFRLYGKAKKLEQMKKEDITESLDKIFKIATNISIIIGLLFTYIQIKQVNNQIKDNKEVEQRKQAVETVKQVRTKEFIISLSNFKSLITKNEKLGKSKIDECLKDLNFVLNVYDDIALIYLSDIADKCLILRNIKTSIIEFTELLDGFEGLIPYEYKDEIQNQIKFNRTNIDLLISEMKKINCN
jgi:hypothetical protein